MSTKADYTPEEWALIYKAVDAIGVAVTFASIHRSSQTLDELYEAFVTGPLAAADDFPDSALVQSIKQDLVQRDASQIDSPLQVEDPAVPLAEAAGVCNQLADLLERKTTPEEADEVKRWLLDIGERVANVTKEGGFLGIGGQRVSPGEAQALQMIRDALRIAK
jgi:hypothetical protein